MFSTVLGSLPAIDDARADEAAAIARNVADLEAAGLELLSDGLPAADPGDDPVSVAARWSAAAAVTSRPVKQAITGPWSGNRGSISGSSSALERATRARAIVDALAAAGCPFIEIMEPAALSIASEATDRRGFVAAHQALLDGLDGVHVSLTLTGGNLDAAGPATFFDLPYPSFAFDLIDGPDNWRLIAAAPGDRGIVCGALAARAGGDETREVLVWAAQYAASTGGRGIDRVGLANASSLGGLPRDVALRKLRRIAEASRIASESSADELARRLDPRAFGGRRNRPGARRAPLEGSDRR
jgi:methionine synthase II (cobalamin-independent)